MYIYDIKFINILNCKYMKTLTQNILQSHHSKMDLLQQIKSVVLLLKVFLQISMLINL